MYQQVDSDSHMTNMIEHIVGYETHGTEVKNNQQELITPSGEER